MSQHQPLLTFNGGEISPHARCRMDLEKAASCCEVLRNALPIAFGDVTKRPGLVPSGDPFPAVGLNSRAFPFTASEGSKYRLVFSIEPTSPDEEEPVMEGVLRIFRHDGTLAQSLPFFPGFTFPEFSWDRSLRDLHIEQINDVAFFTHPWFHPFQLVRYADASWEISFLPFKSAPMLDENTDENHLLSVVSNPIAPTWSSGTPYTAGNVVFANLAEWECTVNHTAGGTNEPGNAAAENWRTYWRRKLYKAGDPVTITGIDRNAPNAWSHIPQFYEEGVAVTNDPEPEENTTFFICKGNHSTTEASSVYDTGDWDPVYIQISGAPTPPVGDLAFTAARDFIYRCIAPGPVDPPDPGVDPGWEDYWEIYLPFPGGIAFYRNSGTYSIGDQVTYDGKQYRCLETHTPSTVLNKPTVGTFWETKWVEVENFLQSTPIGGIVSPGNYWRLSPQRDERDFQVEIAAITGNNGKFSAAIAVQGQWNLFTYGTWSGTFILQKSTNGGLSWETIHSWQATGDRNVADDGFEDEICLMRIGFISETGTAGSGKQRALLIPQSAFVTGEVLVTEHVENGEMTGVARSPILSGQTFRWSQGAFSESFGFPKTIALHETRLTFASTDRNPVSRWFSQDNDLLNFVQGSEDDDGLFRTLPTGNHLPIRWMKSQRRLFLGTSQAEWVTGSETSDQRLTPANYISRPYTSTGSIGLQPLNAGSSVIFAGRKGARLYDLQYTTESGYEATDLSQLAEHLTAPGIMAFAWQQCREPGVWMVRRDGVALHLALNRPQRVWAMSQHDTTGGLFRDVVIFASDEGDDEVFFLVDRDDECRWERFPHHWLQMAEEGDEEDMVYEDGPDGAAIISEIISLPIDVMAENGTTQARKKRPHRYDINFFRSKGGHVWNRTLADKKAVPASADLVTGWVQTNPDAGAQDEIQFKFHHAEKAPFTIRAVNLRWNLKEG